MDKSIERRIRQFEKRAAKAERLNEAAARLLKRASDIETSQKTAFDAIIVKSAREFGLDRLPLSAIISGFATLQRGSAAGFNPYASNADPVNGAETVEREGDADVQASDANIDLIVKISRNTTPKRFALLDEYLIWNGKEGRWMGKVSLLVLKQFEELFEPHRLIYSGPSSGSAEDGAPNIAASFTEVLEDDAKQLAELPNAEGKPVAER